METQKNAKMTKETKIGSTKFFSARACSTLGEKKKKLPSRLFSGSEAFNCQAPPLWTHPQQKG